MNYSESQLINMARNKPKDLINILLSNKVQAQTVSAAVEILAQEVKEEDIMLPLFRSLLRHINAIIREGACIGVSSFYESKPIPQEIIDKLKVMASTDPSPNIRDYAQELLKNN